MYSNHLSNVLANIGDQNFSVMNGEESFIPYFVSSYSLPIHKPQTLISKFQSPNSSPAPMIERTAVVTPTDVRYGFQGQEEDNELWSGAVSFKYRVEDARLGRFFSVDPLTSKYPFYSPYSYCGNRVIDAIELEGLEPLRNPDGAINGDYKPVFRVNLPNGAFATVYQIHGGPYAITPEDIAKINGFREQGFSATPRNYFDQMYYNDNSKNIQFTAGVGGISEGPDPDDPNFMDKLFRNSMLLLPSRIFPQPQQLQQNTEYHYNVDWEDHKPLPITDIATEFFDETGIFMANDINNVINNMRATSPIGSVVSNISVTVKINKNLSSVQKAAFTTSITSNVISGATIVFEDYVPDDTYDIGYGQVTGTQQGPAIQTVQKTE